MMRQYNLSQNECQAIYFINFIEKQKENGGE
jgi:hypothetical protein